LLGRRKWVIVSQNREKRLTKVGRAGINIRGWESDSLDQGGAGEKFRNLRFFTLRGKLRKNYWSKGNGSIQLKKKKGRHFKQASQKGKKGRYTHKSIFLTRKKRRKGAEKPIRPTRSKDGKKSPSRPRHRRTLFLWALGLTDMSLSCQRWLAGLTPVEKKKKKKKKAIINKRRVGLGGNSLRAKSKAQQEDAGVAVEGEISQT